MFHSIGKSKTGNPTVMLKKGTTVVTYVLRSNHRFHYGWCLSSDFCEVNSWMLRRKLNSLYKKYWRYVKFKEGRYYCWDESKRKKEIWKSAWKGVKNFFLLEL